MEWGSFYRLGQRRKTRDLTEPRLALFLAKHLIDSLLMGHRELTAAERQERTCQGQKHT